MAYIYQAAHWCDSCGEALIEELDEKGVEDTGDSGDYPQFFDGAAAETDSPCHCDAGEDCLEGEEVGRRTVGAIVCQKLTSEGVQYVQQSHHDRPTAVTKFWMEQYDIKPLRRR